MNLLNKLSIILLGLVLSFSSLAKPLSPQDVPEPLKPWIKWVLKGHEEQSCPFLYNNGDKHRCVWPSRLLLTLNHQSGKFDQQWLVIKESWVALPGNKKHWPFDIKLDGKIPLVTSRNGIPQILLSAGSHRLSGKFAWQKLPEVLQLPNDAALVSLTLNGAAVEFPNIDKTGQLWLQAGQDKSEQQDRLDFKVFRHISDAIPAQITILIDMNVSGSARELLLGEAFSPSYIPMSLNSPLPARLDPDGRIRIQVRPGHWTLRLAFRHSGPLNQITFEPPSEPWVQEEVWVYQAHPDLRIAEIEGVTAIDPQQTSLPAEWRSLPAYRVRPKDTLRLVEKRRGDPAPPADQLTLHRSIWLSFDGKGYTLQDHIQGNINSQWRLEMNPPISLGRVAVDGAEQFITRLGNTKRSGIEIRQGQLNLVADSQIQDDISKLPAVGWDHDFQSVSAELHLPPGWRLLDVSGVDDVHTTWLRQWSLLDLFLVLMVALAIAKLWSKPLGAIALVALLLTYQEPDAPHWIWINLLVGVALLRVLPSGRLRKWVTVYRNLTLVALIIILIPFSIEQIREGIYPQLEQPYRILHPAMTSSQTMAPKPTLQEQQPLSQSLDSLYSLREKVPRSLPGVPLQQPAQYDPNAVIQTGPGLPQWEWRTILFKWNGPVERYQNIKLFLTGPLTNRVLAFLRVILLVALAAGIARSTLNREDFRFIGTKNMPVTSLWIVLAALFIVPVTDAKAEFPNKELLEELQTRLLEPPDCLPLCADINYLQVDISPTVLSLDFIVDSYQDVAIPLPGHAKQWLPQKIYIDNKPAQGLYRNDDEQLWMFVPAGHHKINTKGILPQRYTLQIALPLKPHHINVKSKGWKVEGLHDDGEVDNQLQFTRLQQTQDDVQSPAMESINFPSFARVERILLLGLTWRVRTTLTRLSPTGSAIVLNIPLLPGESVTTDGIRVSDNKVLVNMDAKAKEFHWESVLDQRDTIVLQAPETTHWIETWKADVSPIWHMSSEGIAVIHHQTANRWLPEWRPWPGEKVILHLNRPQGILGQTVTIDFSELEIKPGQRITDSRLNLRLRSSQGGQQQITLPANAELQSVVIDGQSRPIRQEGRRVLLPIVPGAQNIELKWRVPNGIIPFFKTPDVDLGAASVNTSMEIQLPFNRWALMAGGPQLGPAVLYWGVLIAVVLISFALGRIKFTPLKSYHWLLLGIGLSPVSIEGAVLVIAWLLALGWRKNLNPDIDKKIFNLVQIGLIILTFLALITLVYAISRGLLGYPDMQIIGNGSNNHLLRWYQDRSSSVLPHAWVISIPMIFYRLAMLAWALWLAFALLRWLRWGWENFSTHGYWRSIQFRKGKQASLPAAKSSTAGERGGKG